MELVKERFVGILEDLLKEWGLSRREFAHQTGIPLTSLKRILFVDCSTLPDIAQFWRMCDVLQTTPRYLAEGRGPRYVNPTVSDKMVDIMEAYTDTKRPDINRLINMLLKMDYEHTHLLLKMALSVAELEPSGKAFQIDRANASQAL